MKFPDAVEPTSILAGFARDVGTVTYQSTMLPADEFDSSDEESSKGQGWKPVRATKTQPQEEAVQSQTVR